MASAPELNNRIPRIASIRASVLWPLVEQIDRCSGKADLLLACHGILRSQLNDPYAMIPMPRYVAIFEEAALITGEPTLGARLGTLVQPSDIGPIGVLFSISATMRIALERLAKHANAVQGATSSGLFEENGNLVWSYRLDDPRMWPRRQDSEFSVAAICQLLRSCFAWGWRPIEVHFEHVEPRDQTVLKRIFRCPLVFGETANRILVSSEDANRVHRQEDPALLRVLERHVAELGGQSAMPETMTDQVRALIGIYLGHKPITLSALSAELRISVRTLQRRLSEEGTTLRDLVRDNRKMIAATQLAAHVQKARIAEVLGYADSTVFWRAQKAWRGQGSGPGQPG
ncbi:AraC family transcriptional regulator ligand-binding domain-containing protein [Rhizobium sp. AQ_MP]|uniref:AraC family transcriptional regulator n=1 Tax=Rhizobium sp. AQ_MP TaxID=2761536 RepID=UPI00163A7888|nr:AraC family transcriptional regulator [Rhizobium sp. AQ_MP]MBC2771370.1 AraC family transcriptional regulator ligand-binding domain-containing protein [Rhizobium sp. AQ_MP]